MGSEGRPTICSIAARLPRLTQIDRWHIYTLGGAFLRSFNDYERSNQYVDQ